MRPRRVLVVDDEDSQRRLYYRLLESAGFEPALAESGAKALEFIKRERPKLIVADISMPGTDGIQLYKALRRDHRTADIPVLLMTGMAVPRSLLQEACVGLHEDEIFVKNGEHAHFIGLISKLLRNAPSAIPAAPTAAEGENRRIAIDIAQRRIWIDGHELPRLPAKRYDLLVQLLRNRETRSPSDLLRSVWPESDNIKIVGVSILRLRRDLRDFPILHIETTSSGYVARLDR
jgi:DNA-binding response OmpR family regulator